MAVSVTIIAVFAMVAVIVVVVEGLAWAEAVIDMVAVIAVTVIDVLTDVKIIVVGLVVNVLKFALPVAYSVDDVPSDVCGDLFMAGMILDVLPGIGVEVLTDVSANAFAVVTTALEFPVSTSLEEFNC